jgi:hypothetical protein
MFSTPTFLSIGDDYDKKIPVPDRLKGSQIKTSPSKKGHLNDALFDKGHKSLSEGDKYLDPGTIDKKERIEASKKKITPEGFKFTNPGRKSTGLGGGEGCFNAYPHETEYPVVRKGEVPAKHNPLPKNMTTCPPKKGGPGFPGTTLGPPLPYISDPIDGEKRMAATETKAKVSKFVGGPFRAACKRTDYFDTQPNVAASKVYSLDRALPAKKSAPTVAPPITTPFKPSSPPRKGYNKVPIIPYQEDPIDLQAKKAREEAAANKPSVTWKPVSANKSLPTRSIAFNATAPL